MWVGSATKCDVCGALGDIRLVIANTVVAELCPKHALTIKGDIERMLRMLKTSPGPTIEERTCLQRTIPPCPNAIVDDVVRKLLINHRARVAKGEDENTSALSVVNALILTTA